VDENRLEQIKSDIKNINPLAEILLTNYSKIPFYYIFEDSKNSPFSKLNENVLLDKTEENSCSSGQENHIEQIEKNTSCTHLNLMENLIVKIENNNIGELDKIIGRLLWEIAEEQNFKIIRFKGIIRIKDGENKYKFMSLQGLYDIYEFTEIKIKENNSLFKDSQIGNFQSKILFIGKDLKKNLKYIQEVFNI